jgi:hypothetical protein
MEMFSSNPLLVGSNMIHVASGILFITIIVDQNNER